MFSSMYVNGIFTGAELFLSLGGGYPLKGALYLLEGGASNFWSIINYINSAQNKDLIMGGHYDCL